jgi:hypothetical protein
MGKLRRHRDDRNDSFDDGHVIWVFHREGESPEEYSERLQAAAPPFSERQKETIRSAAREFWSIVRRDRRKGERRKGNQREGVLLVVDDRRVGERRIGDRRSS